MHRASWFVLGGILCLVLFANGQRQTQAPRGEVPNPPPTSHYQLMSARAGDSEEVFVIDTYRGKVWRYAAATATKESGFIPETFSPVGFGVPTVGVPGNNLRDSASDDEIR